VAGLRPALTPSFPASRPGLLQRAPNTRTKTPCGAQRAGKKKLSAPLTKGAPSDDCSYFEGMLEPPFGRITSGHESGGRLMQGRACHRNVPRLTQERQGGVLTDAEGLLRRSARSFPSSPTSLVRSSWSESSPAQQHNPDPRWRHLKSTVSSSRRPQLICLDHSKTVLHGVRLSGGSHIDDGPVFVDSSSSERGGTTQENAFDVHV